MITYSRHLKVIKYDRVRNSPGRLFRYFGQQQCNNSAITKFKQIIFILKYFDFVPIYAYK